MTADTNTEGPAERPENQSSASRDEVVAEMRRSFDIDQAVRAELDRQSAERVKTATARDTLSATVFDKFEPSLLTPAARASDTFVRTGTDVAAVLDTVITHDLDSASTAAKTGTMLSLSDEELAKLNLARLEDGSVTGQIDQDAARALLIEQLRTAGSYLAIDPVAECRAALEADLRLDEVLTPETPEAPTLPESTETSPATDTGGETASAASTPTVDDGVARLMSSVTAPEDTVVYGLPASRATEGDVQEATTSFSLRGGPADVVAYHDFHDLQIAFRHVWTELFDQELAELGRQMYDELVELKSKGWDPKNFKADGTDEIATAEELRELHKELVKARSAVAANDSRYLAVRKIVPDLTTELWVQLDSATQEALYLLVPDWAKGVAGATFNIFSNPFKEMKDAARAAAAIIKAEKVKLQAKATKPRRVTAFLDELEEHLQETYAFSVFAPESVNFGILVTYRQRWAPLSYQVGDLVSTMPLAPKESRRYTCKKVVRKSRAVKEIETALRVRKEESQDTSRDHAEIVAQATNRTNFTANAEGGVNFLVWNAKGSHSITTDSANQSATTKKEFREAVLRAAEEYRAEHRLEVETQAAEEIETTTSGEVTNPNEELSVTYLFYELQRRYEISEKIHRLTPVILVANEMPRPDEVDEDWLLAHDWILRRAMLDDSFLPALDYLSNSFVGDEVSIDVLRSAFDTQLDVVRDVTEQLGTHSKGLSYFRTAMESAIDKYASSLTEQSGGLFGAIADFFFGGDVEDTETLRVRMDAAKDAFQRAERQERELRSRLASEVTALQDATAKYAEALARQFNRRTEILRLRAHVKDNILYYMQAIWDLEPPDQRFFRIHDLPVPDLQGFEIEPTKVGGSVILPSGKVTPVNFLIAPVTSQTKRTLVELADLDTSLGYKGNYTIYPMRHTNSVTTYMMQDYIDLRARARVIDPDEEARWSVEELLDVIRCLQERFPTEIGDSARQKYRDLIVRRLTNPYPDKEVVVVPSGALYIEALPGVHPILEDFKLIHRAIDVKKVQSEVRHAELENLRLAARVLGHEYADPNIDRMIVIEGGDEEPAPATPPPSP